MIHEIKDQAIRSSIWLFITEIITRASAPILTVVLARILAPKAYGVVATATLVTAFAQMFWDAGLSRALVQDDKVTDKSKNSVFWLNVCLSFVIYCLLFLLSPLIAQLFKSPESAPILRVMGVGIIIAALNSVHTTLLTRGLDFKRLFPIRLTSAIIPGLIAIPFAICGYGPWALVIGSLIGQLVNLVLTFKISAWRPSLTLDWHETRRMLRLSSWHFGESLSAWFYGWGDSFFLGVSLGVVELGVYRTGILLVSVVFSFILSPITPLIFPMLSRMQADRQERERVFRKINKIVLMIAWFAMVMFMMLGKPVSDLLFGHKWTGLGMVVIYAGTTLSAAWLIGLNAELYRAVGRPDINAKIQFCCVLYHIPAYIMAGSYGLRTFVIVRLLLALTTIPIHIIVCHKTLAFPKWYLWSDGKFSIMAAACMGLAMLIVRSALCSFGLSQAVETGCLAGTGIAVYIGVIWFTEKALCQSLFAIVYRNS